MLFRSGFAGAGREQSRAFYRSVLESAYPAAQIQIESDALIAYAGALGLNPGALLIAGTGSIAIGRKADGSMIRVGGWGPHFGDEGSGFWIGREAIRVALREADSHSNQEFVSRIAGSLGVASIQDAVGAWASGTVTVPQIAELVPAVMELWPAEPAAGILRGAAAELRRLIDVAAERIDVSPCVRSVAGSIATHPLMRELIGVPFAEPRAEPARGAILLAMRNPH